MRRGLNSRFEREFLVGVAFLALIQAGHVSAETIVGTAGAANTRSTGAPPGSGLRVIEIGTQVVANEKIDTSASGSVQLLFIDKTTLNIGPNSSVVIDKFVFNPATTQGEMALTLGKGVLRLVGGLATHTGGAEITTPNAAIGIRGGILTVTHSGKEGTKAYLGYGKMTVSSICSAGADCNPQTVTVTRPGFMVQAASANAPLAAPVKASAALISQTNNQLTSKAGQSGGSTGAPPTDQQAASYNVGTANSPAAPLTIVNQSQTRGNTVATASIYQATQQVAQQGVQSTAAIVTAQMQTPSLPTPAAYAILTPAPYSTNLGASSAPYLTGDFVTSGNVKISPILGYRAGGLNSEGQPDTVSHQFQAGLSVSGRGAAQSSTIFVMTSQISNAPNIGFTEGGGFEATSRTPTSPYSSVASGAVGSATPGSPPNSVPTDSGGLPVGPYSLSATNVNLNTGVVKTSSALAYVDYENSNYTFNPVTTTTPNALIVNHPNLSLQGYVGGLMQSAYFGSTNGSGYGAPYIVTNATGTPGNVSIYLPGSSSQMGAVFNVASLNPPTNGYKSAVYQFGSYSPADPNNTAGRNTARGTYVDPSDFGARATTIFDNGANNPTTTVNGSGVSNIYGFGADQLLVTANTVGANTGAFLTSISSTTVQPCSCDYTQWGFWSAGTERSTDNGASIYEDVSHLMLWVAGVPTTPVNIPTTGTATYTGHAIADISNNGAQYIAAGTFSNTVNFGTRTGAVSIGGLDATNYAGTVSLTPSTTLFAGSLVGNVGSRIAAINGSFFQGGPTNSTPLYGEMGGSINITGTNNYLGSGIFAARKP